VSRTAPSVRPYNNDWNTVFVHRIIPGNSMDGLIVMHCQIKMTDPIEQEVFNNIIDLIRTFDGPIIGTMNDRTEITKLIKNSLHVDLMKKANIMLLKDWILNEDIDSIYIVGLHYNLCVRQVLLRCEEIFSSTGRTDMYARVVEHCTAALGSNPDTPKSANDIHRIIKMEDFRKSPFFMSYDREHLVTYT
jgi:hypothetical protein